MLKYQEALREAVNPGISNSTASSRPAKISVTEYSAIRHRYNYRGDIESEDGEKDFIASPLADNKDEDLSDVKVVEKYKPKIQRRRVGTARGRGIATPERSDKRTSVIPSNKNQSNLSTTSASSTKRTSVISANKRQSQISFISTSKGRTKHTVSSTIRRPIQIMTHDDDIDDYDRGYVDGGASSGWGIDISQNTRSPKRSRS